MKFPLLQLSLFLCLHLTARAEPIDQVIELAGVSHFLPVGPWKIHYLEFNHPGQPIVIFPGMTEPAVKYWHLAKYFQRQGFPVYVLDHIGQGFSSSELNQDKDNRFKVHIHKFEDYVKAATEFLKFVKKRHKKKPFVLAHSMGGQIAIRTIEAHPDLVDRLVTTAPMLKMELGWMPSWLVSTVLSLFDKERWIPGRPPRDNPTAVKNSRVTHSQEQLDFVHELFQKFPEAQRKGPTVGWLQQSLQQTQMPIQYQRIQIPVLLMTAGQDFFVKIPPQRSFCKNLSQCQWVFIKEARHEIFFEKEDIRKLALQKTLKFFNRN